LNIENGKNSGYSNNCTLQKRDITLKLKQHLLLLLTAVLISSCASVGNKSADLEAGMSKAEAKSILGAPGKKDFSGIAEAWQYCSTGYAADNYIIVWLANDEVIATEAYKNTTGVGACSSFFKTINWSNAPKKVIELREMYE